MVLQRTRFVPIDAELPHKLMMPADDLARCRPQQPTSLTIAAHQSSLIGG